MDKKSGNQKRSTKGKKGRRYEEKSGIFRKKEQACWDYVRQLEIVGLVETWVEERS
jgi:hypothetical protein